MPELDFWESRYWSAFAYLSNRRQVGMGLSPLSYQDIILYLEEERIYDSEIRSAYKKWISFIDNEYIRSKTEENKKRKPKKIKSAK